MPYYQPPSLLALPISNRLQPQEMATWLRACEAANPEAYYNTDDTISTPATPVSASRHRDTHVYSYENAERYIISPHANTSLPLRAQNVDPERHLDTTTYSRLELNAIQGLWKLKGARDEERREVAASNLKGRELAAAQALVEMATSVPTPAAGSSSPLQNAIASGDSYSRVTPSGSNGVSCPSTASTTSQVSTVSENLYAPSTSSSRVSKPESLQHNINGHDETPTRPRRQHGSAVRKARSRAGSSASSKGKENGAVNELNGHGDSNRDILEEGEPSGSSDESVETGAKPRKKGRNTVMGTRPPSEEDELAERVQAAEEEVKNGTAGGVRTRGRAHRGERNVS